MSKKGLMTVGSGGFDTKAAKSVHDVMTAFDSDGVSIGNLKVHASVAEVNYDTGDVSFMLDVNVNPNMAVAKVNAGKRLTASKVKPEERQKIIAELTKQVEAALYESINFAVFNKKLEMIEAESTVASKIDNMDDDIVEEHF